MDYDLALAHRFVLEHPAEAVRVLETLPLDELVAFLAAAPVPVATELFKVVDAVVGARCLERLEVSPSASALALLSLDKAAALLRRLDEDKRGVLIQALPPESAEPLTLLLRYGEQTAGALMNPRALSLPADIAVEEALQRIRSLSEHAAYYLYVVDRDHVLAGVLNMRELMALNANALIASVMHKNPIRLRAAASLESVFAHPGWQDFHTLPVVDEEGHFVGALRNKTLRQIARQFKDQSGPDQTGVALGELYRIGIAGLLGGAAESLGGSAD